MNDLRFELLLMTLPFDSGSSDRRFAEGSAELIRHVLTLAVQQHQPCK